MNKLTLNNLLELIAIDLRLGNSDGAKSIPHLSMDSFLSGPILMYSTKSVHGVESNTVLSFDEKGYTEHGAINGTKVYSYDEAKRFEDNDDVECALLNMERMGGIRKMIIKMRAYMSSLDSHKQVSHIEFNTDKDELRIYLGSKTEMILVDNSGVERIGTTTEIGEEVKTLALNIHQNIVSISESLI